MKLIGKHAGETGVIVGNGPSLNSLLIPFGFGTPIVPIISHDKISDWLEDIGHQDWGIELADPDIERLADQAIESKHVDLDAREMLHKQIMDEIEYINVRLS